MEHPRPELTKEQRVALSFVIFSGGVAVILGVLFVWHHMKVPFIVSYQGPKLLVGDDAANAQITKDKQTDTDGDGLSDYDEKNIYGTSPYLADTDSDGLSDKVEVTNGTDPLCATGKTCTSSVVTDPNAYQATVNLGAPPTPPTPPAAPTPGGLSLAAPAGAPAQPLTAADIEKLKALPIDQIRQLLISSGADAAKVNAATDADVQTLFNNLLASLSPTP